MKKHKRMTPEHFNQVKALCNAGVSRKVIAQVTGKSENTVGWVMNAKTFDDYKEIVAQHILKYKKSDDVTSDKNPNGYGVIITSQEASNQAVLSRLDEIQSTLNELKSYVMPMKRSRLF